MVFAAKCVLILNMKKSFLLIAACIPISCLQAQSDKAIASLLKKMSVEEKVAQLRSSYAANPKINAAFFENKGKLDSLFGNGLSMVNPDFENSLEQSIEYRNKTQRYLIQTKSSIPVIFLDEAHHGLMAMQTDIFPTSIGLACSWDTTLVHRIYNHVAIQARSRGTRMVLAPVVDVTRDPRWGRTGETFGEDPYLCGMMGSSVVNGFQQMGVAATLKHFTGHGESQGGVNQAPADYPERVLRSFHMEPFRLIVKNAKPAAIMPAYLEIDGVPAHANHWLLTDVLRKEWNYKGLLVSDWWAIDQLYKKHFVAKDITDAALQAFKAGVTVDLPNGTNYEQLTKLVKEKKISMAELDSAVEYVLRLKYSLGLFNNPKDISLDEAKSKINTPEGRLLTREAAEKSMVLLKNANNILPLTTEKYKRVAVIGPCAATNFTGDYSGVAVKNVSILEAVRSKFSDVVYAKGVDLSRNGDTLSLNNFQYSGLLIPQLREVNMRKIDSAVAVAQTADIIICCIGENEQYSREAFAKDHPGDVASLDLPAQQNELIQALWATGKPMVVYLAHGRPLILNTVAEKASAIIDGWYSGMEAGNAFVRVLTGEVNPSGKLTISIPRSIGQLPIYYNHKPSAHFFPYVQEKTDPLYSFGFGLSYTTYQYSNLIIKGRKVSIDITNSGTRKGEEIVQLYVHPVLSSVTQPVKALKDFTKVELEPGQMKTCVYNITDDQLKIWNREMKWVLEKGDYEIMIGPNSNDLQKTILTIK